MLPKNHGFHRIIKGYSFLLGTGYCSPNKDWWWRLVRVAPPVQYQCSTSRHTDIGIKGGKGKSDCVAFEKLPHSHSWKLGLLGLGPHFGQTDRCKKDTWPLTHYMSLYIYVYMYVYIYMYIYTYIYIYTYTHMYVYVSDLTNIYSYALRYCCWYLRLTPVTTPRAATARYSMGSHQRDTHEGVESRHRRHWAYWADSQW